MTMRCSTPGSSAQMQPLTAVEVVPSDSSKLYASINAASSANHHHLHKGRSLSTMTPIYENLVGCHSDSRSQSSRCSRRSGNGTGSNGSSTNGLGETDLSYSIEDTSSSSGTNAGSGSSDDADYSCDPRARSSSRSTMRRVWFEDCVLDNVIAQAAERQHDQRPSSAEPQVDPQERSLAKEYIALDEMLRNLQCADVPAEPVKKSVRRKLW
ncbi:hypothetical protein V5799_000957 [Amblyomma americanum]|uniref:Uncharacterized protein n=1 Tax=Amblyomma americanum TaxID=6943 RepID=A0AAQ4D1K0_AMBAM